MPQNKRALERDGVVWFRNALSETDLAELEAALEFGERPGYRPRATARLMASLGFGSRMGELAESVLPRARPVRLVAFNKSRDANWSVPWHQDRVIALRDRAEVSGYSGWGLRDGLWHAEPPIDVLEEMIFARIHFDRTDHRNGAMEIASGSHREGRVSDAEADLIAQKYPSHQCRANRGDVVFIRALSLHRSSGSRSGLPRRALRVDYSAYRLPEPLQWGLLSV